MQPSWGHAKFEKPKESPDESGKARKGHPLPPAEKPPQEGGLYKHKEESGTGRRFLKKKIQISDSS